jgi:hypothetical protein
VRQPCTSGEFGTSEAALFFDYATELSPEAAARDYIESAKAAGWQVAHPPAGRHPEIIDGRIHLVFGRAGKGGEFSLVGTVFSVDPPPAGSRGEGLDKVVASGKKTGLSVWMQADGASAAPAFDVSKGLFPTPDPGIGR